MASLTFEETGFRRLKLIQPTIHADERGDFSRVFCVDDFGAAGHPFQLLQSSLSTNRLKHTIRGLHYQAPPHEENKVVRCVSGAVFDVVVDLRSDEPTYGKWFGVELTAANATALLVPVGFAHGFCTLMDRTSVLYMMDERYDPQSARGVRWDDPGFGIEWPCTDPILSRRDASWPDVTQ